MSLFNWLIVGHLIGDWLLQNDWMARGKKQGLVTPAGIVHFSIYTAVILTALWLSGAVEHSPALFLGLGGIIFISHWLVDATDIVGLWMYVYRQSNLEMIRVMVDQMFHLLILVLVAILL